jgi:phage terminase large subunit
MILTKKQTSALDVLEDDQTKELIFGGGAGGAKSVLGCYRQSCIKDAEGYHIK